MDYTFNFTPIVQNADLFIKGGLLTIRLSASAMALGTTVGIVGAVAKIWGPRPLKMAASIYVEIIRNTPSLVQLFIIFFGLPSLGITLSANVAALVGLTIFMGAYATEIIRAGIQAVPKGQIEAALSLGMTSVQVFRHVILLPGLKLIYPALTSQFVLLLLASSLVSLISAKDLFYMAGYLESRTFLPFEIYLVVCVFYLLMSLGFRVIFWILGRVMFSRI